MKLIAAGASPAFVEEVALAAGRGFTLTVIPLAVAVAPILSETVRLALYAPVPE